MLPRKERLSRQEFNRFFSLGKRLHSPGLTAVYAAHPALHVSVVVPKKVSPKAVQRNKIRRRIYDIVRRYRTERGTRGVFIFITKPAAAGAPYAELQKEVHSLLSRIPA